MEHGHCNSDCDNFRPNIVFEPILVLPQIQQVGYVLDLDSNLQPNGQDTLKERCKSAALQKLRSNFGLTYSERVHERIIDMINQCRYIASKKGMDKRQLIDSIRRDEMAGRDYVSIFQNTPWKSENPIKLPKISFTSTPTSNMTPSPNSCVNNNCAHCGCGESDQKKCWETICPNPVTASRDGIMLETPNFHHHHPCPGISHPCPDLPRFMMESDRKFALFLGEGEIDDEDHDLIPMDDPDRHQCQHDHVPCIFVARPPPTRSGFSGEPLSFNRGGCDRGESLMDGMKLGVFVEDSSDESDFDPSQTSDFFEEINSANSSINKKISSLRADEGMMDNIGGMATGSSHVISPNRKPGSHNLAEIYKGEEDEVIVEEEENECEKQAIANASEAEQQKLVELVKSSEVKQEQKEVSSSDEYEDYDEDKEVMITTARVKACASYIQLRQKLIDQSPTSTRPPLFGTFDEFDQHLMQSDFEASASGHKSAEDALQ